MSKAAALPNQFTRLLETVMKMPRPLVFTILAAGLALVATRWCVAQSAALKGDGRSVAAHDSGLALHQLELLVAHLEAKQDTKALKLFSDYQHALEGQQASAAI